MALKTQLQQLKVRHEALAKKILRLRHDPQALEGMVRQELGYVYPDEYILIMPDDEMQAKESK